MQNELNVNYSRHILNTGQGVVMEQSPYSDYVHWDAGFNQGWIDSGSKKRQLSL